jgi:hypothetical protein
MSYNSIFFDIIEITKKVIGGYQNEKGHLRIRGKNEERRNKTKLQFNS